MKKILLFLVLGISLADMIEARTFTNENNMLLVRKRGHHRGSDSQFAAGGGFAYMATSDSYSNFFLSLRGSYSPREKLTGNVIFSYGLPATLKGTLQAYDKTQFISQSVELPSKIKVSPMNLDVNLNYFIATTNEDDFGFYAVLGFGIHHISVDEQYEPYDHTKYDAATRSGDDGVTGFTLNLGLGLQLKTGPVYIFAEPMLTIPATSMNDIPLDVELPASVGAALGVSYKF